MDDRYLHRLYKNLHSETGLSSLTQFARSLKATNKIKQIEKSLSKIPSFALHRPVKRNYGRKTVALIVHEPGQHFSADVKHLEDLARFNSGIRFLLIVRDSFSKLLSVIPMRRQTSADIISGLKKAFKQLKSIPTTLFTDRGSNFVSAESKAFYKEHGINHVTSVTPNKSFIAENAIKGVSQKIYRFLDLKQTKTYLPALDLIVKNINSTVHSSTKFKPRDVGQHNKGEVFSNLFSRLVKKPVPPGKFRVGDKVYLARTRLTFDKGYKQGYNPDILIVDTIKNTYPIKSYTLRFAESGIKLKSSFVDSELVSAG